MNDSYKVTVRLIPVFRVLADMAGCDLRQRTMAFWFESSYFN